MQVATDKLSDHIVVVTDPEAELPDEVIEAWARLLLDVSETDEEALNKEQTLELPND